MAGQHHRLLSLALLGAWCLPADSAPDFSGAWRRDRQRAPAFAFGPPIWTIHQTESELTLETGGQHFIFRLDGTENEYADSSLGDLPNFIRKIRTKARWDGTRLRTERTSFAEEKNPQSGAIEIPPGAITIVEVLQLSADRRTLAVDHSGFRGKPPDLLHGKPYDRDSDPAVR